MANVIEFTIRAIDKSSGPFGKVNRVLGGTIKAVAAVAAAAAAAGGALGVFTAASARAQDQVGKIGSRLGFAVEQLSTFTHVAAIAGVESRQFTLGVQRMTRRVSEAAVGMGEAQTAIAELGLSAQRLKDLTPEEALLTLADRFQQVESQADRVRLAFKLFDTEGVAMVQMLQNGSAEMRRLAADAQFLGATMSKQAVANATALTDAMTRATAASKGMGRAIADELTPVMTGLANKFADSVALAREDVAKFVDGMITNFFVLVAIIDQVTTKINALWDGIRNRTLEVSKLTDIALGPLRGLIAVFEKGKEELGDFGITAEGVLGKFGIDLEAAKLQAEEWRTGLEQFGTVVPDAMNKGLESAKTFGSELTRINQTFMTQQGLLVTELAQGMHDLFMGTAAAIGDAIASVIIEGKGLSEAFKELTKLVAKELISMLVRIGVQRLITAVIFKGALVSQATGEMAQGLGQTYVNAFKSTAAIPIVGPALAPGVAAASVAAATAGAKTSAAIGAGLGAGIAGAAHNGLTNVPREGTFLLDRGERVLSPEQNTDLTEFLSEGGGGVRVDQFNLTIEVGGGGQFPQTREEWRDTVELQVIPALNVLDKRGIRQNSVTRRRG